MQESDRRSTDAASCHSLFSVSSMISCLQPSIWNIPILNVTSTISPIKLGRRRYALLYRIQWGLVDIIHALFSNVMKCKEGSRIASFICNPVSPLRPQRCMTSLRSNFILQHRCGRDVNAVTIIQDMTFNTIALIDKAIDALRIFNNPGSILLANFSM